MAGRKKTPDPLEQLGRDLAADHTTAKNVADTVAAGAIEGAGAVMDAGGDANQTAAGAIGGAAAATAEVLADNSAASNDEPPEVEEEGDVDAAFERRMDRLCKIVEEAEFDGGTAVGDIRDCLLELFKTRDKPWHMLDANMRRDLDNQLTKVAQLVVRKVALVIAEEDSVTLQGTMLDALSVKGETLEVKLKVEHVDKDVLMDAYNLAGQRVVVISASDKRFGGARRPNDPGEQQTEIPFADAQDKPPVADPPADDKDLAADDDGEQLEAAARDPEAPDWAVYDDEGEVWLSATSEDDPWTDNPDKAMRFTLQAAKDECESHGEGMIVQVHALATDESDEG